MEKVPKPQANRLFGIQNLSAEAISFRDARSRHRSVDSRCEF